MGYQTNPIGALASDNAVVENIVPHRFHLLCVGWPSKHGSLESSGAPTEVGTFRCEARKPYPSQRATMGAGTHLVADPKRHSLDHGTMGADEDDSSWYAV